MNCNEYFWPDSTLEKIEIEYDKIVIIIFNDVLQKNIRIACSQCAGMTQIINWDEVVIENVFLQEITDMQHPMLATIQELYGTEEHPALKSTRGSFYELKIQLLDQLSFSVICKNVCFTEER